MNDRDLLKSTLKNELAILTHLPAKQEFTLLAAVQHFGEQRYRGKPVRAALCIASGNESPRGFRVRTAAGSIVAWMEVGQDVLNDSMELAGEAVLPAPPEVISSCAARLSVWADDRIGLETFHWFASEMSLRFGALHYDHFAKHWLSNEASVKDFAELGSRRASRY